MNEGLKALKDFRKVNCLKCLRIKRKQLKEDIEFLDAKVCIVEQKGFK